MLQYGDEMIGVMMFLLLEFLIKIILPLIRVDACEEMQFIFVVMFAARAER